MPSSPYPSYFTLPSLTFLTAAISIYPLPAPNTTTVRDDILWAPVRVITMSLIRVTTFLPVYLLSHRAKPYVPFACPFLDHHLDALTERVEAPKLVIAVTVYSFSA